MAQVLLMSADPDRAARLEQALVAADHAVEVVADAEAVRERLAAERFDVVVAPCAGTPPLTIPILVADDTVDPADPRWADAVTQAACLARQGEALREALAARASAHAALEAFARAAAAALGAPFEALAERMARALGPYRGRLDAEADEFLDLIEDAGGRMRAMLHSLAELGRVGERLVDRGTVDLEGMFRDAAAPWEAIVVEVSGLPRALSGAPALLREMADRLLDNAMKFHAPGRSPRVRVHGVEDRGGCELWVRDEGLGIPAESRERVFETFRRLHGRGQYGGVGCGLSLARAIVHAHGGRIWIADPPDGPGIEVHVRLPGADPLVPHAFRLDDGDTLQAACAATATALCEVEADVNLLRRELGQFGPLASHDLQEPIRTMSAFGRLVVDRYGDRLDAGSRETIAGFLSDARSFNQRVKAMVDLAAIDARLDPMECVDLVVVAAEVIQLYEPDLQHLGGSASAVGELPRVRGDESQLWSLLSHLVDNAVKFRAAERPPRVEIDAVWCGAEWEIRVSDNGTGIPAGSEERVFEPFARLPAHEALPGAGVGLALCRRIVERHGGRIWLTTAPDAGTCVHFTLPDAGPEDPG